MRASVPAAALPRGGAGPGAFLMSGKWRPARSALFSCFITVAILNGLAPKMIVSLETKGLAESLLSTFGVSAVVWIAAAVAIALVRDTGETSTDRDLVVAAIVLPSLVVPIAPAAWLGLTVLALHICASSARNSAVWRGGWIALGVTVPVFWTPSLFKLLSQPILMADATLVSWLVGLPRDGNVVALADGSGSLWIAPECSSLANVSLAILCWMTFMRAEGLPLTRRSLAWCALGCVLVVCVNIVRISLIALYPDWYEVIHGPYGALVASWTILFLIAWVGLAAVRSGRAHLV
ncbi:MAG: hypothetical protein ABW003_13670 [Microvirga sp.]